MHIISPSSTSRHTFSSCAVLKQCQQCQPLLIHLDDTLILRWLLHIYHTERKWDRLRPMEPNTEYLFYIDYLYFTPTCSSTTSYIICGLNRSLSYLKSVSFVFFFPSHSVFAHVQLAVSDKSQPTAALMQLWIWLKFDIWGWWLCTF